MSWKSRYGRKKATQNDMPTSNALARMKLPKNARVIPSPPGQKMSDALWEFIQPYIDCRPDDHAHLNKLLAIAMIAWNAAIAPADEREQLIDACLASMPAEARVEGRSVFEEMMVRKALHFGDNQRMIFSFEFRITADGPNLVVTSSPPAGTPAP